MTMRTAAARRRSSAAEPFRRLPLPRILTSLCASCSAIVLLCTACGYTGSNSYFFKTVEFQPHATSKDQVMILLADTAPVSAHYHVGEVKVTRGTMDSDAALYDAMRDLGVKYGFDGVNDIVCGENYSLTEPYVCTGAAFVIKDAPGTQPVSPQSTTGTDQQSLTPSGPPRFYADENTDFGVTPERALQTEVGTPTPKALPADIGKTITTQELSRFIAERNPLLVDVLNEKHQYTIKDAFWLPEGGQPGNYADANQDSFEEGLSLLIKDPTTDPIVFFCLGARCWESYNAVLRARSAGFKNLYWYRGGINAWMEAGNPVEPLADPF
jgi:PQQ-dependent catabolism-associated CXXCW motif protein